MPGSIAVDGGKAASAVPPHGAAWVTTWCPIWNLVSKTAVNHYPTTFLYSSPVKLSYYLWSRVTVFKLVEASVMLRERTVMSPGHQQATLWLELRKLPHTANYLAHLNALHSILSVI